MNHSRFCLQKPTFSFYAGSSLIKCSFAVADWKDLLKHCVNIEFLLAETLCFENLLLKIDLTLTFN